jgi:hypothetical protein
MPSGVGCTTVSGQAVCDVIWDDDLERFNACFAGGWIQSKTGALGTATTPQNATDASQITAGALLGAGYCSYGALLDLAWVIVAGRCWICGLSPVVLMNLD